MGVLRRLADWWESPHPTVVQRLEPPSEKDAAAFFDGIRATAANIRVNEDSALRLPVYSGGSGLITGAVAKLPLRVVDDAMRPVRRPPPWTSANPCPGLDAASFKRRYSRSQIIRGFTVLRILSWVDSRPWRLEPLPTKYTTLHSTGSTDRREAVYTSRRGGTAYRFIEWMGPGDDQPRDNRCLIVMADDDGTVEGRSTLDDLAPTIALGLAMMEHASFVFTYPTAQNLIYLDNMMASGAQTSPEEVEAFGEALLEVMQRPEKRHQPVTVNSKVGVEKLTFSPEEAQLIEARNQIVEEVCRRLWIAPQLLALPTTTWGTGITEMRRALHQLTVPAWTEPMLSGLNRTLPKGQRAVFDTTEVLRGDLKSEAEALERLAGGPSWTPNEARAYEGKPPMDGGDELRGPRAGGVTIDGTQADTGS